MTKEDAMKYLKQLYPNGGHCWLDEQRIEAISMAIKAMQEDPVSEKKCLFTKDNYTDEDRKVLCEDCDEDCEYAKKEKPVSEDLGEYINELSKQFPEVSFAKLSRIAVRVAKWQEQQMMEKAVEWLRKNWRDYINTDKDGVVCFGHWQSDFRKAMSKN